MLTSKTPLYGEYLYGKKQRRHLTGYLHPSDRYKSRPYDMPKKNSELTFLTSAIK